jgi:hypothetical protein
MKNIFKTLILLTIISLEIFANRTITVGNVSADENKRITFDIIVSGNPDYNITGLFKINNISTSDNDYNSTANQNYDIRLTNGNHKLSLALNDDNLHEKDELFKVTFYGFSSDSDNIDTNSTFAIGTIKDNDLVKYKLNVIEPRANEYDTNMTFDINLTSNTDDSLRDSIVGKTLYSKCNNSIESLEFLSDGIVLTNGNNTKRTKYNFNGNAMFTQEANRTKLIHTVFNKTEDNISFYDYDNNYSYNGKSVFYFSDKNNETFFNNCSYASSVTSTGTTYNDFNNTLFDIITFTYQISPVSLISPINDYDLNGSSIFQNKKFNIIDNKYKYQVNIPLVNDNIVEKTEKLQFIAYGYYVNGVSFTIINNSATLFFGEIIDDDMNTSLHLSNLDLNEYNVTKIVLVDENNNTIDFNGKISRDSNLTTIINKNIDYYLKFILDGNKSMWYNFKDKTIQEKRDYSDFKANSTNILSDFNISATYDNWKTIQYKPTIKVLYDKYREKGSIPFDIKVFVNDKNKNNLNITFKSNNLDTTGINFPISKNYTNSQYINKPFNIKITPNNISGKVTITITAKDKNSKTSKKFDIIVEDKFINEYNILNNTYNNDANRDINFNNQKLFTLNDNIYNNYDLGKDRYIVNLHNFDKADNGIIKNSLVIDTSSIVKEYILDDEYYQVEGNSVKVYSNSSYKNKLYEFKYTNEYDKNSLNGIGSFVFVNDNSKAYKILKKYLKPTLELYEDIIYRDKKYTSLNEFKSSFAFDKNSMGLVRNYNDKSKMLFLDNNNSGQLVELDDNGNITNSNAGTWEEILINSYKYKDKNQVWHNVSDSLTVLILYPTIEGYSKGTAFGVANSTYVKMGQYFKANEVVQKLYYNSIAMNEIYSKFSKNPKIKKSLNNGWTYLSLPTKMILCDSSIQSELTGICNQNYSFSNVFTNKSIKFVLRNINSQWTYWDKENGINPRYRIDKYQALNYKDGILVKTSSAIDINLPYDMFNDEDIDSFNIETTGWKLISLNNAKTVQQIKTIVEAQNKMLKYILLFRDNKWMVYSPTLDSELGNDIQRIERINRYESFWINTSLK